MDTFKIPSPTRKDGLVIGAEVTVPHGCNRKEKVPSLFDNFTGELIYEPKDAVFMTIELLCGKSFEIQKKEDFPLEDVPCTCGDKNHYFIKYKEDDS